MKPNTSLFLLFALLAVLFGRAAAANDIAVNRFAAYTVAAGSGGAVVAGTSTPLTVSELGTAIKIQLQLRRPTTSVFRARAGLYVTGASGPTIGTYQGNMQTVNRDNLQTTFTADYINNGYWYIDNTNTSQQLLDMDNNSTFSFTLGRTNPGVTSLQGRFLYVALFDEITDEVFAISQGIPLVFTPPPGPIVTSITPSSGRFNTPITIYGSGFTTAQEVRFGSGGIVPPRFTIVSNTEIRTTVPNNATTGMLTVISSGGTSNGVPFTLIAPTVPPVLLSFDLAANRPQTRASLSIARPGDQIRIQTNTDLTAYTISRVEFNGASTTDIEIYPTLPNVLFVRVPAGSTPGQLRVVTTLGNSNELTYRWPRPQNACGDVVCGTQCVPYGGLPTKLQGRLLAYHATDGSTTNQLPDDEYMEYAYYLQVAHYFTEPFFANGTEEEQVQWQYSYSGNWDDFHNIDGNATSRDFQPWACYATTYYRRVSSHILINFWGQRYRREWYISNVVTITPSAAPATPTQSIYYACAGTSFSINFTPGTAAQTSSWSLPGATWSVNGGQGVIGQSSYNVGATTSVTVSVPAGWPSGLYEIHTSSNGTCGTGNYRVITVEVGRAPASEISGSANTRLNTIQIYTLNGPGGSGYIWTVPPGWSIISGQGTTSLRVRTSNTPSSDPVYVDFDDACTNAGYAVLYVENSNTQCRICPEPMEEKASTLDAQTAELYPNPANGEVTLRASSTDGEATFYDSQGQPRKTVKLKGGAPEVHIELGDLPAGLYHVRLVSEGRKEIQRQLLIQR